MNKILVAILIPLLIAMPISEIVRVYFFKQHCQVIAVSQKMHCECSTQQMAASFSYESSCCCIKSDRKDKDNNAPLSFEAKPIEYNLVSSFEYSSSIDISKKINIIENYTSYLSAGISTFGNLVLYSPPIYQQYCSLRI